MMGQVKKIIFCAAFLLLTGCAGRPHHTRLGGCLVVQPKAGETLLSVAQNTPEGLKNLSRIAALNPPDLTPFFSPLLVPTFEEDDLGIVASGHSVVPVLTWRFLKGSALSVARLKRDFDAVKEAGFEVVSPNAFLSWLAMERALPKGAVVVAFEVVSADAFRRVLPFVEELGAKGLLFFNPNMSQGADGLGREEVMALGVMGFEPSVIFDAKDLGAPFVRESLEAYALRVRKGLEKPLKVARAFGGGRFALVPEEVSSVVFSILKAQRVEGVFSLKKGGNTIFSDPLNLARMDMGQRAVALPMDSYVRTFEKVDLSW